MALHPDLRRAIYEAIIELGSQTQLADALGATQGTISRWMSDAHSMDVPFCLKFARVTGADATQVLRWAGHDPDEYLPSTLVIPSEGLELQERVLLQRWFRSRQRVPEALRPVADTMIEGILDVMGRGDPETIPAPRPRPTPSGGPARAGGSTPRRKSQRR